MSNLDSALKRQDRNNSETELPGSRSIWPSRPTSLWGWLLWLIIALLFFLLISYVIVPWWYQPVPTSPPAAPSNSAKPG